MDFTKTKTFIAFVNIDGKDRFWVDSNDPCDKISPKIYPYETKEEKDTAKLIGYRTSVWSESGDRIEGVLLKVSETIPVITRKEAEVLEEKWKQKLLDDKEAMLSEKSKKKVPEIVPEKPPETPKEVPGKVPVVVPETISKPTVDVPRGRGRPRKIQLIEP